MDGKTNFRQFPEQVGTKKPQHKHPLPPPTPAQQAHKASKVGFGCIIRKCRLVRRKSPGKPIRKNVLPESLREFKN
jgi:hypothetical protein